MMQRPSRHQRGYTNRWAKAAKQYLKSCNTCAHCKLLPATCVDHIEPHNMDMRKFWDKKNNWQPLCWGCHNAKTQRERSKSDMDWPDWE